MKWQIIAGHVTKDFLVVVKWSRSYNDNINKNDFLLINTTNKCTKIF